MFKLKFVLPVLSVPAVICNFGGKFVSAMTTDDDIVKIEKQGAADENTIREFVKAFGEKEGTKEFNLLLKNMRKFGKNLIGKIIMLIHGADENKKEILKNNAKQFILNYSCKTTEKNILQYASEEKLKALFGCNNSEAVAALLKNSSFHYEDKCKKFFESIKPCDIEVLLQFTPCNVISSSDLSQVVKMKPRDIANFLKNIGAEKNSDKYNKTFGKIIKIGEQGYQKIRNFIDKIEEEKHVYSKENIKTCLCNFISSNICADKIKSLFNYANKEQLQSLFEYLLPEQLVAILCNMNVEKEDDIKYIFDNVENSFFNLGKTPVEILFTFPLEKLVAISKNIYWREIMVAMGSNYRERQEPSEKIQKILKEATVEELQNLSKKALDNFCEEHEIFEEKVDKSVWDSERVNFTIMNEQDNI